MMSTFKWILNEGITGSVLAMNENHLILSPKIQEVTGWKTSICTMEELYYWLTTKYGNQIDLNQEVGQLLRTMKPDYYFAMIAYLKNGFRCSDEMEKKIKKRMCPRLLGLIV